MKECLLCPRNDFHLLELVKAGGKRFICIGVAMLVSAQSS